MPKIDLGKKLDDMIKIHKLDPDEAHYPELCISDTDDERIAQMPDSGTATITYKVISKTHREERSGKRKAYSCSIRLQVLAIDPPNGGKRKNGDYDGGARRAVNDYFRDK